MVYNWYTNGIQMVYNWYTNSIQLVYECGHRFCGWVDVDLSTLGEHEAETAGQALVAAGLRFPFKSENTPH